ncbi:protein odr-4 homolog isoform X1 [Osmerus mordax]|uniref:protein odr-4 homolog isoform X1 n=1 Tax=Osmerus mordax TaxID=8014 RepID=UPI00350F35E9
MGRGYIVEEFVQKYLFNLTAAGATSVTGLLIGQSAPQRDYVVLAARTPPRDQTGEGRGQASGATAAGTSLDHETDVEWVSEHARQVSRMLPGGLSVVGVFLLTPPEVAKEAQNTLRQLVFAVDKLISRCRLWSLSEDDVTDRVTLHICSTTRKMVCRTFDVGDPKSSAKPADWKPQAGVCVSWPVVTCCVDLDLLFPLAHTHSPEDVERCMKAGLQTWAQEIEQGVCLLNGRVMSDDSELGGGGGGGQKKNMKAVQQIFRAQILVKTATPPPEPGPAQVEVCGGVARLGGVVSCRAFLHSNRPRARQAAQVIKRDVIATVTTRVEMLLEDHLMSEGGDRGLAGDQQQLPVRVFAAAPCGGVCACDYMFADEGLADVSERIREMLDWDTPPGDLEVTQEVRSEPCSMSPEEADLHNVMTPTTSMTPQAPPPDPPQKEISLQYYAGVAMATAVALLATVTSLLYLSD